MRVTKKFTGACCIGKRVFNVGNRRQLTHADVQAAMQDLDKLEARFWATLEQNEDGYRSSDLMKRSGLGDAVFLTSYMGYPSYYHPSSLTPLPPELDPLKNPALYKSLTAGMPVNTAFFNTDFKNAAASAVPRGGGSLGNIPFAAQQPSLNYLPPAPFLPASTTGVPMRPGDLEGESLRGGNAAAAKLNPDNSNNNNSAKDHHHQQQQQQMMMMALPPFNPGVGFPRGAAGVHKADGGEDFEAMVLRNGFHNNNNHLAQASGFGGSNNSNNNTAMAFDGTNNNSLLSSALASSFGGGVLHLDCCSPTCIIATLHSNGL